MAAESLGLSSVWVGDTLLRPVVEPLTVLSAVAAVTRRIGLGTATLLPLLRRPVQTASVLASVDRLSGGRLTVGVGAGFPGRSEREYAISEVPWERRFVRLDETVGVWRQLWAGEPVVIGSIEVPPVVPPAREGGPAVWLGGAGRSALGRAGRLYDGWLPYPPTVSAYASGLAAVRAGGREIAPALFATVLVGDDEGLDAYVRAAYGMPRSVVSTIQLLVAGPAEHVRSVLDAYVAAGARHLVLRIAALDLATQREQLALIAGLYGPAV
ncbi:LLM class flavin-dependent oxidoreductase [Cryptosporangium phraense]|uniref:LLM class flavin-dependent oxidoreductase n=1 Tax=Cryptosporangium phraense TaxID=2593070 RepID=UPI001F10D603|nr:LLM class flavin-dependent oxidoreductase [Cryptosporangium phraense]